jgi:hypothetical protein
LFFHRGNVVGEHSLEAQSRSLLPAECRALVEERILEYLLTALGDREIAVSGISIEEGAEVHALRLSA